MNRTTSNYKFLNKTALKLNLSKNKMNSNRLTKTLKLINSWNNKTKVCQSQKRATGEEEATKHKYG